MSTPKSYKMNDHELVFFNQYRQLCMYNKTFKSSPGTPSEYIKETFVLLRQQSGFTQHWIEIKQDGYNLILECLGSAPDATDFTYDEYDFSNDAGQIWFDNIEDPSIVIGMGDIRDGITGDGKLIWYSIPQNDQSEKRLIIECNQPFVLRIHRKGFTATDEQVTFIPVCNQ